MNQKSSLREVPQLVSQVLTIVYETRSREELLAELSYLRMENAFLKKLEALTREQPAPKKRKSSRR